MSQVNFAERPSAAQIAFAFNDLSWSLRTNVAFLATNFLYTEFVHYSQKNVASK